MKLVSKVHHLDTACDLSEAALQQAIIESEIHYDFDSTHVELFVHPNDWHEAVSICESMQSILQMLSMHIVAQADMGLSKEEWYIGRMVGGMSVLVGSMGS